jgi:pyruvate dehydrogenase E1 component alpha subunit
VTLSATSLEEALAASMSRLAEAPTPFRVLDDAGRVRGPLPELSDQRLRELYRWMVFGRQLDERGLQLQRQGRLGVWGPMVGQEAAQAGLGLAMQDGDWVFPSYREAIVLCMRGLNLADMLAYYRGLYWTADPADSGAFPIQIVIGDQTLHAVGAGIGFALQHQPRVAVAAIGDGATSEGDFLEALNFAGVFKAQAVVFIQNNQWAISLPRERQSASQTLAQKALAFGMPGLLVDGNDALAVYACTHWALEHARSGRGPVLVEALTYRIGAHTTADDPRRYQPSDEIEAWRARDPLARLRRYLEARQLWDSESEANAVSDALNVIDTAMHESETREQPSLQTYIEVTRG